MPSHVPQRRNLDQFHSKKGNIFVSSKVIKWDRGDMIPHLKNSIDNQHALTARFRTLRTVKGRLSLTETATPSERQCFLPIVLGSVELYCQPLSLQANRNQNINTSFRQIIFITSKNMHHNISPKSTTSDKLVVENDGGFCF